MPLLARIFVVLFAFLLACVVAAVVVAFAVILPASASIDEYQQQDGVALAFAMIGVVVSFYAIVLYATLPAMLVIALAEALRLRSLLFYGFAGAALALGLVYGEDLGFPRNPDDDFGTRGLEIAAAIGIAAGFVYWALAGRNAGAWRRPAAFPAAPPPVHPPS